MRVGTKSLLFGVHQFLLHPLLVALAWRRLFGSWPRGVVEWVSIIVHDWGYWGCRDMDGEEGKWHPILGARVVSWLFEWGGERRCNWRATGFLVDNYIRGELIEPTPARRDIRQRQALRAIMDRLGAAGWQVLLHSRSIAARAEVPAARFICAADKAAVCMYPRWLYLLLARASGELKEYIGNAATPAGAAVGLDATTPESWWDTCSSYMMRVAEGIARGEEAGVPPEDAHLGEVVQR